MTTNRKVVLTSAAGIKPRPVFWLWDGRLALGTLGLLAGREGLGKSTLAYWVAGQISRGLLPGQYHGTPKSVLVCATEDSWEHTIVPRLIAAGADLSRVYRVEVSSAGLSVGLGIPRDNAEVERVTVETDAALLLLDPLMSRLDEGLDAHRDGDVRRALEPLVAVADRTSMSIFGVIHHNKSGSTDPLQLVMGSKAFTAVARSVHTVVPDSDDDTGKRRLYGVPKNNLGPENPNVLAFTIESYLIDTADGPAWTGQLIWGGEIQQSISESMRRSANNDNDGGIVNSAMGEAADWMEDYLTMVGGSANSADVKKAGRKAGHSDSALHRARLKMKLTVATSGRPLTSWWALPTQIDQSGQASQASQVGESYV